MIYPSKHLESAPIMQQNPRLGKIMVSDFWREISKQGKGMKREQKSVVQAEKKKKKRPKRKKKTNTATHINK